MARPRLVPEITEDGVLAVLRSDPRWWRTREIDERVGLPDRFTLEIVRTRLNLMLFRREVERQRGPGYTLWRARRQAATAAQQHNTPLP